MEISRLVELIAETVLFASFSKDEITALVHDLPCSVVEYKKGSVVYLQGDTCTSLDLILRGEVSLQSVDVDGNTLWIQQILAGEILGAGVLFSDDNRYPVMSLAETDVSVFQISQEAILSLCRQSTDFSLAMFREVAKRTAPLTEQLHSIAYNSIRQRLRNLLLQEARRQESHTVVLPESQKDIAKRFGVQRQSLSRELHKMRREGLLEYKNRIIQLHAAFFKTSPRD